MHPGVANPMGKRIILTWVGDGEHDSMYEDFYRHSIKGMPILNDDGIVKSNDGQIVTAETIDGLEINYF